jgi:hypothetical protein
MAAATNAKNVTNINGGTVSAEHIAFLVANEYDELTARLEPLPDLIELLIQNYNLNSTDFSQAEIYDLGMAHGILYSTLKVVQDALYDYQSKFDAIDYKQIVKEAEL